MEADDKSQGLWIGKIRSRMYLDRHLLAISLTSKLNLYLSVYETSHFSPFDQVQLFKTLFFNHNFFLYMTRHMSKYMTGLSFVYLR